MIPKDEILKLNSRGNLYEFILKNPGLHLHEIKRRTNIPLGCLRYHLNYLEKVDIILKKPDLKYTRYYVKHTVGKNDKKILNLLRQETTLKIIIMLLLPGDYRIYNGEEIFQKSLSKFETFENPYSINDLINLTKNWKNSDNFYLRKHRTTVEFHLKKLLEADLVEKIKEGKEIKYKLKDEDMTWRILIKYKDALSKESIDEMFKWKEDDQPRLTDKIINVVWEIFPHPYYA